MNSRIPLPTDNIYKFYALFGLLLLITTVLLFLFIYSSFQERSHERYVELKIFSSLEHLSVEQEARKEVLEAKEGIDKSDKAFYLKAISIFAAVSIILIIFGFIRWHTKVQPIQDEIAKKELEKISLEIKALKKCINNTGFKKKRNVYNFN